MVRLGSDLLLASSRLNGTTRRRRLQPRLARSRLRPHRRSAGGGRRTLTLAAIFGPQHGFRSDVQDNMIETPHAEDPGRRVPIYSLYSETREPTAEMLRGLDVLVIDLQDVGARIYTYIYTMANCMRACARHRHPGHRLRPSESDRRRRRSKGAAAGARIRVVRRPVPDPDAPRHDHRRAGAAVQRRLRHRRARSKWWRWRAGSVTCSPTQTGLPWVMPSPNMPTLDTAIVYPGTVLFEGTMISEGRGTTRPFELVGAPWIEAERFARDDERARPARRALPTGRVRADVPEARASRRAAAARST